MPNSSRSTAAPDSKTSLASTTPAASAATSSSAVGLARLAAGAAGALHAARVAEGHRHPREQRADARRVGRHEPGNVAEPTAWEKKASRRSTIQALSSPPAAASSRTSASASRRNGEIAQIEG